MVRDRNEMFLPQNGTVSIMSFRDSISQQPKIVVRRVEGSWAERAALLLVQSLESKVSCVVFSVWGY